jgi:hypothetical protein
MFWIALGCMSGEPVLTSLSATPAVVGSTSASEPLAYTKPENVLVDVPHMVGKSLDVARGDLEEQLGSVQTVSELGAREGREIVFDRGHVRELNGSIYLVYVDLPRPMRRSEAMFAVGLPSQVREWLGVTLEWRTSWAHGMERIRMGREERDSEFVLWVEVRRYNPRKR